MNDIAAAIAPVPGSLTIGQPATYLAEQASIQRGDALALLGAMPGETWRNLPQVTCSAAA